MEDKPFVLDLLERGLVTVAQVGDCQKFIEEQRGLGRQVSMRRALVEKGFITPEQIVGIIKSRPTGALIAREMFEGLQQAERSEDVPTQAMAAPRQFPHVEVALVLSLLVLVVIAARYDEPQAPAPDRRKMVDSEQFSEALRYGPEMEIQKAAESATVKTIAVAEQDAAVGRLDQSWERWTLFRKRAERFPSTWAPLDREIERVESLKAEAKFRRECDATFALLEKSVDALVSAGKSDVARQVCEKELAGTQNPYLAERLQVKLRTLNK
jgi:hypothetical protein